MTQRAIDSQCGYSVESLEREIRSRGGSVTLGGSVSAATLAEVLGVSLRTIERWRELGVGPAGYRLPSGGRVFYRLVDVVAHLNAGRDRAA